MTWNWGGVHLTTPSGRTTTRWGCRCQAASPAGSPSSCKTSQYNIIYLRRLTASVAYRRGQRGGGGSGGQAVAAAAGRAGPSVRQWKEPGGRAAYCAGADPGGSGDQPDHHLGDRRPRRLKEGDYDCRNRWQWVRSLRGSEEESWNAVWQSSHIVDWQMRIR